MSIDAKRLMEARVKAVAMKCEEMAIWYLANSGGVPPENICEDKKAYGGVVLRWLEPPIPFIDNPMLVETYLGDSWVLRFDRLVKT